MAERCPVLRFEVEKVPSRIRPTHFYVYAYANGTEMGYGVLDVPQTGSTAQVGYIAVEKLRCGYGTKLYEKMQQIACENRRRLVSDRLRSAMAEGFWKKQFRKGRARCIPNGVKYRCKRYEMIEICPKDSSLARAR
jgi:hypothetical protein